MAANYSSSCIERAKTTISICAIKCGLCLPAYLSVCLRACLPVCLKLAPCVQSSGSADLLHLPSSSPAPLLSLSLPHSPLHAAPCPVSYCVVTMETRPENPASLRGSRLPSSPSISRWGCAPSVGRFAQRRGRRADQVIRLI